MHHVLGAEAARKRLASDGEVYFLHGHGLRNTLPLPGFPVKKQPN